MKLRSRLYAVAPLLMLVLWTSCIKDKCGNVLCYNKGVCVDGQCTCPSGYEGAKCETGWFEKFAGEWNADDTYIRDTTDAHVKYDIKISGVADSFKIYGLYDSLDAVMCKRRSLKEFTISSGQVMRSDSSIIIRNGEGKIENGIVTGLYSFKLRDTILSVKFKWTK